MLGKKTDAFGPEVQGAAQTDFPQNIYCRSGVFLKPAVRQGINRQERLAARRTIPFLVLNTPQNQRVSMQGDNTNLLVSQGLAQLPQHGGSLWKF